MSESRPLLVVTPTLGRSPWLDRAVASVAAYAGQRSSHLLVAPMDSLADLRRRFPQCMVVCDIVVNGIYPAINLGLANAPDPDWRWFTWLNDDDELTPGFARHLARALTYDGRQTSAPWYYGQVQLTNVVGGNLGHLAVTRFPSDIVALSQCGINPLNQQGLLTPRAWAERCGPLREDLSICADIDFWLRAAVLGARFRYSVETVAMFRLRTGQISGDVLRHRAEFQQVVQGLAGISRGRFAKRIARLRFRVGNVGVYAERIYHCGWKGGFALLERPVRKVS